MATIWHWSQERPWNKTLLTVIMFLKPFGKRTLFTKYQQVLHELWRAVTWLTFEKCRTSARNLRSMIHKPGEKQADRWISKLLKFLPNGCCLKHWSIYIISKRSFLGRCPQTCFTQYWMFKFQAFGWLKRIRQYTYLRWFPKHFKRLINPTQENLE